MSRLSGRLSRLEEHYRGCPGCAERAPLFGLCSPSRPWQPPPEEDTGPCALCGEPREVIVMLLSFDWSDPEGEQPARGSLQWQREQRAKGEPAD
jgi:hypothetical protein